MTAAKLDKSKKLTFSIFLSIGRFIIVFGLGFIILKPTIIKLFMAFKSQSDLLDNTVKMIPKHFSLHYWTIAFNQMSYPSTALNTLLLALSIGLIQVFSCTCIGYGLGRFKFKGAKLAFGFVIAIMLVPFQIVDIAQYLGFVYFGIGHFTINLSDTFLPLYILAFTGLGIKEGLYIYLLKETFSSLPKDLEDAAYIDGAGVFKTFFSVMLPNARTMMITVFLFSFCWQWTDTNYSGLYLMDTKVLANVVQNIEVRVGVMHDVTGMFIAKSAGSILIMIPLLILFIFCQKFMVNSIARSGLSAD